MIRKQAHPAKPPRTFQKLNSELPLRPIADGIDLENAIEMADRLAVLETRSADQNDYLETLSTLIEKYEDEHHAIETDDLSAIELLKTLMEGRDMSASDLGRLLGERSLGAAILRGQRELSKSHIKKLAKYFGVSPALFLR